MAEYDDADVWDTDYYTEHHDVVDQVLPAGHYVVEVRVNFRYQPNPARPGTPGRNFNRWLIEGSTVPRGRKMWQVIEACIENRIDESYLAVSPPEVTIQDVRVHRVAGPDRLLADMPLAGFRTLEQFMKRNTERAAAAAGRRGAAPVVVDEAVAEEAEGEYQAPQLAAAAAASRPHIEYSSNMDIPHHVSGTQCIPDYLLFEAAKMNSGKGHWTRKWLRDELGERPSVNRLIKFAQSEGDVSVFACDIMLRVFAYHRSAKTPRVWLVFMVKDNHCLPITNKKWRQHLMRTGEVPMQPFSVTREALHDAAYYDETEPAILLEIITAVATEDAVLVLPVPALEELCAGAMLRSGKIVESAAWSGSGMTMFRHPGNGAVVVAGPGHEERRAFCEAYLERTGVADFVFANQSWGALSSAICTSKYLALPPSVYTEEYRAILQEYPMGPYRMCGTRRAAEVGDVSIDIRRCYTYLLRNMPVDWPIFGPMDHARVATADERLPVCMLPGEYYVARTFHLGDGTIQLSRGWYPTVLVKYAVETGVLAAADVPFVFPASKQLPKGAFQPFCDDVEALHPDASKDLLNMFVGCLGIQDSSEARCGSTTDLATAVATLATIQARGNQGRIHTDGTVYMLQETERTQRSKGGVPLYRAILAGSYVMLDGVIRKTGLTGADVLCYNTDSVKVRRAEPVVEGLAASKEEAEWGDAYIEVGPVHLNGRPMEDFPTRAAYVLGRAPVDHVFELGPDGEPAMGHEDEMEGIAAVNAAVAAAAPEAAVVVTTRWVETMPPVEEVAGGSCLLMGPPGCGKTYTMVAVYQHLLAADAAVPGVVVSAYTHSACKNLRDKGLPARVFSALAWNSGVGRIDYTCLSGVTHFLLDEYTMLPPAEMRCLLEAQSKYGFALWAAGDHNQCCAPVDNPVAYHTNPHFLAACGNRVFHMAYKPDTGRYDAELQEAVEQFQSTCTLAAWRDRPARDASTPCYTNICFTNKKRATLNAALLDAWVADNGQGLHDTPPRLTQVGRTVTSQAFLVAPGLPVMVYYDHIMEHEIFKTQTWTVDLLDPDEKTITISTREPGVGGAETTREVVLEWAKFCAVFDYSFAITVHKCQGLTLDEYVIHEAADMSFNVLYTAISRGRTLGAVHIDHSGVKDWNHEYEPQVTDRPMLLKLETLRPVLRPVFLYIADSDDDSQAAGYEEGTGIPEELEALCAKLNSKWEGTEDQLYTSPAQVRVERVMEVRAGFDLGDLHRARLATLRTVRWVVDAMGKRERAQAVDPVEEELEEEEEEEEEDSDSDDSSSEEATVTAKVTAHKPGGKRKRERKGKFLVRHQGKSKKPSYVVGCRSVTIEPRHRKKSFYYRRGSEEARAKAELAATQWSAEMKAYYY